MVTSSRDSVRNGREAYCKAIIFLCCAHSALQAQETSAYYVEMQDGTRLAVDVHLPTELAVNGRAPALLEITRYWRASEDPESGEPQPSLNALDRFFIDHGYVVIKVDARGSGASFGTRPVEYGPQEVRDGYDVVDWVVRQSWSNGVVGGYGTSYSGTTAELLAAAGHPAVMAVVPGWSDFDIYASPVRPYGLVPSFIEDWGDIVGAMDRNDASVLGGLAKRVDEDPDGAMRDSAVAMHGANPSIYETVMRAEFRDDVLAEGITYQETGPLHWREAIERSGIPMLVLVSWLDAGTIEGAFQRFEHFRNRQNVVIMATSHAGGSHASPFVVSDRPLDPVPSVQEQFELRLAFFDHHLKGADNGVDDWPPIRYYNMSEEAFHSLDVWPHPDAGTRSFYLGGDRMLGEEQVQTAGREVYEVDFSVTTGRNNRWRTQMGGPVLELDDRGTMDERMLTFTTRPFEEDMHVLGTPVVTLLLSSTHTDGAVLVYLEDVDENEQSRYLTEGGIRLVHRALEPDLELRRHAYHSFARVDGSPMVPGEVSKIRIGLWPTAVTILKGHRLRIAMAGADAGTFERMPAHGDPKITIHWGPASPSHLQLPVVVIRNR